MFSHHLVEIDAVLQAAPSSVHIFDLKSLLNGRYESKKQNQMIGSMIIVQTEQARINHQPLDTGFFHYS